MQQLSIGAFSRLTHLSIKTLRYYHQVGLLEPAVVDPDSGYRYYRPGQAHSAQLVRRFRDLGLPVADVKALLATPDLTARDAILADHLDRMREQLRQTEAAARWELPAGRFAVALHTGTHSDIDRTYAALGTYADAHDRDGTGPVRERYLTDPLE
jgi:DNA-binding transcriptional MerR regulator